MLRCPGSNIGLTSTDVSTFEHRFAARHTGRLEALHDSNARISPGPGHEIKRSITPAGENPTVNSAWSFGSQATLHLASEELSSRLTTISTGQVGGWDVDTPATIKTPSPGHLARCSDAAHAASTVFEERQTTSSGRSSRSLHLTAHRPYQPDAGHPHFSRSSLSPQLKGDEAADIPRYCTDATPISTYSSPTSGPLSEPISLRERFRLKAGRLRHRHSRSVDDHFSLPRNEERLQTLTEALHEDMPTAEKPTCRVPAVPSTRNPILDPQATIFVCSTGIVPTTAVVKETDTDVALQTCDPKHLDGARSLSSAFSYSSSCQTDGPLDNDDSSTKARNVYRARLVDNGLTRMPIVRSGSRCCESARGEPLSSLPRPSPVLDRYPMIHPAKVQGGRHFTKSRLAQPGLSEGQSRSSSFEPPSSSSEGDHGSYSQVLTTRESRLPAQGDPHVPSSSPTTFLVSPSGQYSATRDLSRATPPRARPIPDSLEGRTPSMVSAASGISSYESWQGVDATNEFMLQSNSPLDQLTDRLGGMQVAFGQHSFGMSCGRPHKTGPAVSLLNGNPFNQESPQKHSHGHSHDLVLRPSTVPTAIDPHSGLGSPQDRSTLSHLAPSPRLSSSSSPPTSPTVMPSSPPLGSSSPTHAPVSHISPARSPGSPLRRDMRHVHPSTPRVTVYNDSASAHTQPQTPADVRRSERASRRSGRPTRTHRTDAISPSPTIPPRVSSAQGVLSPVRQRSPQRRSENYANPITAGMSRNESPRREQIRQHAEIRRVSDESSEENDIEAHLEGLEDDRRRWLGRQDAGSLDTTPPAEGRFEMFLS